MRTTISNCFITDIYAAMLTSTSLPSLATAPSWATAASWSTMPTRPALHAPTSSTTPMAPPAPMPPARPTGLRSPLAHPLTADPHPLLPPAVALAAPRPAVLPALLQASPLALVPLLRCWPTALSLLSSAVLLPLLCKEGIINHSFEQSWRSEQPMCFLYF